MQFPTVWDGHTARAPPLGQRCTQRFRGRTWQTIAEETEPLLGCFGLSWMDSSQQQLLCWLGAQRAFSKHIRSSRASESGEIEIETNTAGTHNCHMISHLPLAGGCLAVVPPEQRLWKGWNRESHRWSGIWAWAAPSEPPLETSWAWWNFSRAGEARERCLERQLSHIQWQIPWIRDVWAHPEAAL